MYFTRIDKPNCRRIFQKRNFWVKNSAEIPEKMIDWVFAVAKKPIFAGLKKRGRLLKIGALL